MYTREVGHVVYQVMDLFENKFLHGLKLCTPYGLENQIRWLHVAELSQEVEQLPAALKSNDLLIVMGPILSNDPERLMSVVQICVQYHCAALLLYRGAMRDGIPSAVLAYAKASRFPILEVQEENPAISNLTSTIMRGIAEKNYMTPALMAQNLILDIVNEDYCGDPSIFYAYAAAAGFELQGPLQAVVVQAEARPVSGRQSLSAAVKQHRSLVTREIPQCVDGVLSHYYPQKYLSAVVDDAYVLLLPENSICPIKQVGIKLLDACLQLEGRACCTLRVAVGSMGSQLEDFSRSIREAKQLLDIMRLQGMDDCAKHVDDMYLSLIVRDNRDAPLFRRLYETTVLRLLEMDKAEKFNLLESLTTYFDCDKNISRAADQLYLHRNTMKSRLERIESLTGRRLSDPLDCLELQMALHYYKLNYPEGG